MLNDIRDWLKNVIFSRFFVLIIVFIVLFAILIQKLFVLQIINGEDYLNNFTLTIKKETTLKSARGNIYDREGNLLAYNELAYSVTIEDNYESGSTKNEEMNDTILRTVHFIEGCGDKVLNNFNIVLNEYGKYEYTVSDTKLLRFLADVYGHTKIEDLKTSERNATPEQIVAYLAGSEKYEVGKEIKQGTKTVFVTGEGYTDEEILQIITIRYAMSMNNYQKYLSTVIASDVCSETVAVIMENKDTLQGVDIEEDTLRKYNDAKYFSSILGYTGNASTDDLESLAGSEHDYTMNDMVGKAGIEKTMEEYLQGTKGKDVIYVDNVGKVIETASHIDPKAGNDVYLSIDANLQKAVYNMLEQKLAGILVSKIVNVKEYNNSEVKSSLMMIPIDDVYFALINNNVIDIDQFDETNADAYEKQVYSNFLSKQERSVAALKDELLTAATPYEQLTTEMQVYESYIVSRLASSNTGILINDEIDREDPTYLAWTTDETISLKEYLTYALSKNWIDISRFNLSSQYSDTEEVYSQLVDFICEDLKSDNGFSKKLYKYMIRDNELTGREICMVLFEQRAVYGTTGEKEAVESGTKTAYDFLINKISNIEITPAQLALDPSTGSCVVTGTNGELLACVTYPGYDSNRLANTIDADYYAQLMSDLSSPMYNCATQQMTAPGSTFKMVSAVTALEDSIVNLGETIQCRGIYDTVDPAKKCWIYPGAHGNLDVTQAIGNSCNSFFYEVGYRLSTNMMTTAYSEKAGLDKLKEYADLFGLTEKTGIEMEENEPKFSDVLPIDSAIGQGSHNYTTIGLARYVTAIANKGKCYQMSLVSKVTDSSGTTIENFKPQVRNQIQVQDSTWSAIQSGMRIVAEKTSAFKNFPINVAGKTGTAQTSTSRTNHALFLGFAPYENPKIAVAVRIAYGYTSANAAAVAGDVFKYYFELEDTDELINGVADTTEMEVIED
ncbi:MAG: penicillin-binding transpeptidase domain-containing protein [Lachnospiraceae bacterium]